MKRGMFITFEGLDGAGKSTQVSLLADWLRADKKIDAIKTREPGGTEFGETIRNIALTTHGLDGIGETLLMTAARREHIRQKIEPALSEGKWVICDRFSDSTFAYQGGGRDVCPQWIENVLREVEGGLCPDLTFYLAAPADSSHRPSLANDVFESRDNEYYRAVAAAYEQRVAQYPQRIVNIAWQDEDGIRRNSNVIAAEIKNIVAARLAAVEQSE
ncbi:MAG: dTMP kinase [Gammaproteobacteria bacterium WSBS_2016_MAG_OTU1]